MARALVVLACLGTVGCSSASTPRQEMIRAPEVCTNLANSFALIAQQRHRGLSRDDQVAVARRSAGSDASLRHWVHLIDLVYRFEEDASPQEIGMTVLDRCEVDDRGRASVNAIWPSAGPADVAAPPAP